MGWIRLDDRFPRHPKVLRAGPLAAYLDICGLAYCGEYLTDGAIPDEALATLVAQWGSALNGTTPEELAGKLVDVGRWERVDGGYQVHDYLVYNPTRAEEVIRRERGHEQRRSAGRARAADGPRDAGGRFERGGDQRTDQRAPSEPAGARPADGPAGDQPRTRTRTRTRSRPDLPLPGFARSGVAPPAAAPTARQRGKGENPEQLVELWNAICVPAGLPRAMLTEQRRRKAKLRLRERSLAEWSEVCRRVAASPFLRGQDGRWRATLDWLLRNEEHAVRVLEGSYDSGSGATAQARDAQKGKTKWDQELV